MPEILQFDLVPSALFEGDFTAKPEKHLLITELEIILLKKASLKHHLLMILCP